MSAKSLSTVPLAAPVMRQVARIEFPSTRAEMIWVRCCRESLFMPSLCLTVHALSRRVFPSSITPVVPDALVGQGILGLTCYGQPWQYYYQDANKSARPNCCTC